MTIGPYAKSQLRARESDNWLHMLMILLNSWSVMHILLRKIKNSKHLLLIKKQKKQFMAFNSNTINYDKWLLY